MRSKKILILISLFGLLTSCSSANFNWAKYKTNFSAINLKSSKYENFDTSFDYARFNESIALALSNLRNNKSVNEIVNSHNAMVSMQNELSLKYSFIETEYLGNPSDENYNAYQKARTNLSNFSSVYFAYLILASEGSAEVKKAFFGDRSDAEIAEYLSNMTTSQKIANLQNKINELSIQGQRYSTQFSNEELVESEYFQKMLELLISVSNYEHQLEEELKVDDYLNHIYKNTYRRPYKKDEVNKIGNYIKEYATNYLDNYIYPEEFKYMSPNEFNFAMGLGTNSICSRIYYTGDVLNQHASKMGGKFLDNYNHLWNNGYYYFSNNENCLGTASTSFPLSQINDSVLFFGRRYQSAVTVEHEFGHYNALRSNQNNRVQSYDTLEIHSQGNEFLYLDTFTKFHKNSSYKLGAYYYADNYYLNRVNSLINLISTSLIENYVFDNYLLPYEEIASGVNDIIYSLGAHCSRTYWAYGSVCQPGYYISYVTSLITSLEIGCQAASNFDNAKTNYMNLVNYGGASSDFFSQMNSWNLHSPFDEEAYRYVFSNIPIYK